MKENPMRLAHLTSLAAVLAVASAAIILTGGSDRSQARPAAEHARMAVRPLSIRPAGRPATRAHGDHRKQQTRQHRAPKAVQHHPATTLLVPAPRLRYTIAAPARHPTPAPVPHRRVPQRHTPAPAPRAKRPAPPASTKPKAPHDQGQQPPDDSGPTLVVGPIEVHGGGHGGGKPEVTIHGGGNGGGNGGGGD
jgi:hypothetical protein